MALTLGATVELNWLSENSAALSAYRGEWLLIQGEELVTHSKDFHVLCKAIRDGGISVPFVYYVPLADEEHFVS